MGNDNAQSLTRLQEETQMGKYDLFIHNGDFAYDMEDVKTYYRNRRNFLEKGRPSMTSRS